MLTTQPAMGFCPMGCGRTLAITPDGTLRCRDIECPDPETLHRVLNDERIAFHVVHLNEKSFSITHPLGERLSNMAECPLHVALSEHGPPEEEPGLYIATRHEPDAYSESYRGGSIGWDFLPIDGD